MQTHAARPMRANEATRRSSQRAAGRKKAVSSTAYSERMLNAREIALPSSRSTWQPPAAEGRATERALRSIQQREYNAGGLVRHRQVRFQRNSGVSTQVQRLRKKRSCDCALHPWIDCGRIRLGVWLSARLLMSNE